MHLLSNHPHVINRFSYILFSEIRFYKPRVIFWFNYYFAIIEASIFLFIFIKYQTRKSLITNNDEIGNGYDQIEYKVNVVKENLEGSIIKLPNLLIPELNVFINQVYKQIGFKYNEDSVTYLNTRKDKTFTNAR